MIYFGYGSNLNDDDLARWCREHGCTPVRFERMGIGYMPERALAFTHRSARRGGGVLDIPDTPGGSVAGVLFRGITDESLATLDRKESSGHTYRRLEGWALTDDGAEVPVFSYEVAPSYRHPFVAPSGAYLDVVREGYAAHGLAMEPLEAAARGQKHFGPVDQLFVYGTLRHGGERHPALPRHGAQAVGRGTITGALLDLGPYPGLICDGPDGCVTGEVYAAPDPEALLAELDVMESFRGFGATGSLYRRAIVRVALDGARTVPAWTYVYCGIRTGARVIASGEWPMRDRP